MAPLPLNVTILALRLMVDKRLLSLTGACLRVQRVCARMGSADLGTGDLPRNHLRVCWHIEERLPLDVGGNHDI